MLGRLFLIVFFLNIILLTFFMLTAALMKFYNKLTVLLYKT